MKYSEILTSLEPIEQGDFMLHYEINSQHFIVYSPEASKVSCVDLSTFRDISAYELACLIQLPPEFIVKNIDEFIFSIVCSKEKLISYLFDIEETAGNLEICHVANSIGYLLMDTNNKIKNLYRFNKETKEYQLVFENMNCFAKANENSLDEVIYLCFNPSAFQLLQENKSNLVYLLPSANFYLCSYLLKKVSPEKKIVIYVDKNVEESLMFLSYLSYESNKCFQVQIERGNVVVMLRKWNPINVINMLSKTQKKCNEKMKSLYNCPDEKNTTIFDCQSINEDSYILFKNNKLFLSMICQSILFELKLDCVSFEC